MRKVIAVADSRKSASSPGIHARLGSMLVQKEYVTEEQLAAALKLQQETGAKLGEALVKLHAVTEYQVAEAVAAQKKMKVAVLEEIFPNPAAVSLLSEKFERVRQVLPYEFDDGRLLVAMVNPLDVVTIDDVQMMTRRDIVPMVATETALNATLDYYYSNRGSLDTTRGDETAATTPGAELELAEEQSVVSIVNDILDTAAKRRASDVHLEPQQGGMSVRLRVDGVLHQLSEIPSDRMGGVVSRIKIMGDIDIAEKRLPQDGRATYRTQEQNIDLRIATIPTVYGENVTIRLLDESMYKVSLANLGMSERDLRIFRRSLSRPHGQLLISGPTGSGKSTTLYSALDELNRPAVKIYTVEDPVERKMPGILQTQVKASIGLTFAKALRSLVRSDPDIIMIGEIRDLETAVIATEAALTGHLVLSTVHTNDAPTTVTRLSEMGVAPYLTASCLDCVVAQRLARRLCPRCHKTVRLTYRNMSSVEREMFGKTDVEVSRAVGCRNCFNTGYSGRIGLYEVLPVTKDVRRMILDRATADEVRDYAVANGMTTLKEDGVRKILEQITTVEEVARVTI
jgi:type IV pilus assembly protein PilB